MKLGTILTCDDNADILTALDYALADTFDRIVKLNRPEELLRTMAQAKCYDDITAPGLLDDASWFDRHGSPNENMKLWYYRGRIQSDLGNVNDAAIAYSRAESFAEKVQDQHALGLSLSQEIISLINIRANEPGIQIMKFLDNLVIISQSGNCHPCSRR